jgi:integrase
MMLRWRRPASWFVDRRPEEDVMESVALLDLAGRRRSPATLSSFHQGRPPRNKGLRYPPDPPTVAEIVAVMRAAGDSQEGVRLRGVIIMLWRAGLRISEALTLVGRGLPVQAESRVELALKGKAEPQVAYRVSV